MNDIAIEIENLSKEYRVSFFQRQPGLEALRPQEPSFLQLVKWWLAGDRIWALRDISLQIERGEALGIIGANGAGKTTLLKILSRITDPTRGRATIRGRVGTLLEVGTGFHPELTGRENVYMSGSILGMKRNEIDTKFDEIVSFSGVEDFLDIPVKRYSSGMQVRLAFSVAIHLDPEILLIDEVLAVGDMAFRRKSLGKMTAVTQENRTILFVSHNMAAIESLCSRAVYLEDGQVAYVGDPRETISFYMNRIREKKIDSPTEGERDLIDQTIRRRGLYKLYQKIRLLNDAGEVTSAFRLGETIHFEVTLDPGSKVLEAPRINIPIFNSQGLRVCNLSTEHTFRDEFEIRGETVITCRMHDTRLAPDVYYVKLGAQDKGQKMDAIENAISFDLLPSDIYGTGRTDRTGSIIEPSVSWTIENSS